MKRFIALILVLVMIGGVYSFGNVFMNFINLATARSRDIPSFYEKNIGKMNSAIEKTVETFQSMD